MSILASRYSIDIDGTIDGLYFLVLVINEIIKLILILMASRLFWIIISIILLIIIFFLLQELRSRTPSNKINSWQLSYYLLSSPLTFKAANLIWKHKNKIPQQQQKQILKVAKKLSAPETRQLINQTATNLAQQYLNKNYNPNNGNCKNEQLEIQTVSNKQIEELMIETEGNEKDKIEINNKVKEQGKTKKVINQTAKVIAKAYLKETSEIEEFKSKPEEQNETKSRILGKTARLLARKYLNQE